MYSFHASIERFGQMGEKTNWYYVLIPQEIVNELSTNKKVFPRVKGLIDAVKISQLALWAIGDGDYILPLNGKIRKDLHKDSNNTVHVQIEKDDSAIVLNAELLECLQEEPVAYQRFFAMNKSWQNNFSKLINDAKTPETKAKRIAKTIRCMLAADTHEHMLEEFRRKDIP
jgi:hypothetical protein